MIDKSDSLSLDGSGKARGRGVERHGQTFLNFGKRMKKETTKMEREKGGEKLSG